MSEKPCPNCGHCAACGRSNLRPGPYPYLHPPYYPGQPFIYGGTVPTTTTTPNVSTDVRPNQSQAVGSADLSQMQSAQNLTATPSLPFYFSQVQ